MNSSQKVNPTVPMTAVVAKTRPRTPWRWSCPAARRARIQRRSMRLSSARPPKSRASRARKPSRMPSETEPVRY